MPTDTIYTVTGSELTSIADAIRTKGDTSASLAFPSGFVEAIGDISSGGGGSSSDAYDLIIKCNGNGFTTNKLDYEITKGSLADILPRKETNPLITGVCHTIYKTYDDEEDTTFSTYLTAELVGISDNYSGQEYPGYSSGASLRFLNLDQKQRIYIACNDEEEILNVSLSSY